MMLTGQKIRDLEVLSQKMVLRRTLAVDLPTHSKRRTGRTVLADYLRLYDK